MCGAYCILFYFCLKEYSLSVLNDWLVLSYVVILSKYLYHKLNPADCVVSLKSIPNVTAIVAPGPSDAIKQKYNHNNV